MRPVPPVAAGQFGTFTTAQAVSAGWTSHGLRHAVAADRLIRVRAGVYAERVPPTADRFADAAAGLQRRAAAVSLANRRVPISHGAAAVLHGMSLRDVPERVCATCPRPHRSEIAGVHVHPAQLFPGHVVRVKRIMALSAARTVVDLAREKNVDDAIAAADSALRFGRTTPELLDEVLERCAGWPGVATARRIVAFADPAAESVLESLSRLRIADAGLPAPQTQLVIRDAAGRFCGRCDFYWEEFGVVGECDGHAKLTLSKFPLRDEKVRQGYVEDTGLIVVRWCWDDLDPFGPAAMRLAAAFARGLRPDRAPRRWRVERPAGHRPRAAS